MDQTNVNTVKKNREVKKWSQAGKKEIHIACCMLLVLQVAWSEESGRLCWSKGSRINRDRGLTLFASVTLVYVLVLVPDHTARAASSILSSTTVPLRWTTMSTSNALPRAFFRLPASVRPTAVLSVRTFSVLNRLPPNYEGHVPLTAVERGALAVGSAVMSLMNPRRGGKHTVTRKWTNR